MMLRRHVAFVLALGSAAAVGCGDDLADSLLGAGEGQPQPGKGNDDPGAVALGEKVVAGPAMMRNISNREYLNAVSDLIGERLSPDLQKAWTATTQFSGFDAVPWSNLDTKAVRDLGETIEAILDRTVASTKVMKCVGETAEALVYDACARSIVEPFATRAFGRPLVPAETESFALRFAEAVTLAQTALTTPREVFLDAIRAPLGAVLLAPQFLTRTEAPPTPEFVGERDLSAYELASRLSFMFTASIPDDELWSTAVDGSLASNPDVLAAQVTRLIDTKTETFVQSFMGQWFDFRAYDSTAEGSLERAMWNESWRVFADVVKEDLPVTALVQPGFTYLNQDLAKHYSLAGEFGPDLVRVSTSERGGVLQQGAWLSLSANPLRTSAIHRGRLVQDRLLCKAIPPPDSALFEQIQKVQSSIPPTASVKERLEAHRKSADVCFGCHQYMDPIGLGLEGFDMHGKLRNAYADTGKKVEVESTLLDKPFKTFGQLNQMVSDLPDYQRCAAEKLAVYSARRIVNAGTPSDADLLAYLSHPQGGKPPTIRTMVTRLVTSNAFRKVNHGAVTQP